MQLMASTPAVREGRVHTVPGSLITWHGTRLAQALTELPPLLRGSG
jgi:ABC-type hemin transport system substrate-binding protein